MKKIIALMCVLAMCFALAACGSSSKSEKEKYLKDIKTEFVSVDNGSSKITAAEMNGLGAAHPTVSFTDSTMNLYYVMAYPEMPYVKVDANTYTIYADEKKEHEAGTITKLGEELTIKFDIQGVRQTYVFKVVE